VVNILDQLATLGKVTGRGRRIFRKSGRGGKYSGPAGNTEQGYWAGQKKNIQREYAGVVNIPGHLATLSKVTLRGRRRIFRKSVRGGKYSGPAGNTKQDYWAGQTKNIQKEWAGR
jgi:hypothetical protein